MSHRQPSLDGCAALDDLGALPQTPGFFEAW